MRVRTFCVFGLSAAILVAFAVTGAASGAGEKLSTSGGAPVPGSITIKAPLPGPRCKGLLGFPEANGSIYVTVTNITASGVTCKYAEKIFLPAIYAYDPTEKTVELEKNWSNYVATTDGITSSSWGRGRARIAFQVSVRSMSHCSGTRCA